jgi:membrane-associated PAP2 superfamily phosphatase
MLESFLSGAISMGFLVSALFFIRFWKTTRDRLFLFFSMAFGLLLAERVVRATLDLRSEWIPAVYMFRLIAFGLILFAIFNKNRRL